MTAERKWEIGTRIELNDKTFMVCEICEEPNIGLVVLVEETHILKPRFTIPYAMLDVLAEHHKRSKGEVVYEGVGDGTNDPVKPWF